MPLSLAALLGLILGSFYSVCASRYGTGATVFLPLRSFCPQCSHQLSAQENIPLVSYTLQRGRCIHCNAVIPFFYPLIELISMSWAILAARHTANIEEWLVLMIIGGICIVASAIDLRTFLLPDCLTYSGAVIVLGASFFDLLPVESTDALLGASISAILLWGVAVLFRIIRKMDGLGFGDVKFSLMLGGLVGWQGISWLLLCTSSTALIYALLHLRGHNNPTTVPIPFGPFLALGACITFFYGAELHALVY